MAEMRKEENRIKESIADSLPSDEVPWRLGKPEVVIPLAVQHGQKMSLRLVLRDEQGEITWTDDLGELEPQPGASPGKAVLKIGTFLKGKRHGSGKMVYSDGGEESGNWENGALKAGE